MFSLNVANSRLFIYNILEKSLKVTILDLENLKKLGNFYIRK